jgi:hypothetical protein
VDEGLEAAVDDADVTPELPRQPHVALQYIYMYTERERESTPVFQELRLLLYKYI